MNDSISNYANLVPPLEQQELQSSLTDDGHASPLIYSQLLALYLLLNDLTNAQLLWKRIPDSVKESSPEIVAIWDVGMVLIKRELPDVYAAVDFVEWAPHLKNIMACIKESTRQRVETLIAKAYTSIELKEVAHYFGLTPEETVEQVHKLGWSLDPTGQYVMPKHNGDGSSTPVSLDTMMTKLTEYVSFLENK